MEKCIWPKTVSRSFYLGVTGSPSVWLIENNCWQVFLEKRSEWVDHFSGQNFNPWSAISRSETPRVCVLKYDLTKWGEGMGKRVELGGKEREGLTPGGRFAASCRLKPLKCSNKIITFLTNPPANFHFFLLGRKGNCKKKTNKREKTPRSLPETVKTYQCLASGGRHTEGAVRLLMIVSIHHNNSSMSICSILDFKALKKGRVFFLAINSITKQCFALRKVDAY